MGGTLDDHPAKDASGGRGLSSMLTRLTPGPTLGGTATGGMVTGDTGTTGAASTTPTKRLRDDAEEDSAPPPKTLARHVADDGRRAE